MSRTLKVSCASEKNVQLLSEELKPQGNYLRSIVRSMCHSRCYIPCGKMCWDSIMHKHILSGWGENSGNFPRRYGILCWANGLAR
ncbi:hypothetical protein TNIN_308801, partial [Trichonephila inaurata madagascariensis]